MTWKVTLRSIDGDLNETPNGDSANSNNGLARKKRWSN